MEFFLAEGGSFSYDAESIDDIEVPLRYKNLMKRWVPKDIPQVNIDFCLDERIYLIAPSSLHGLGLFSMDVINVFYCGITELMEYVGPCYNYRYWMKLVQPCALNEAIHFHWIIKPIIECMQDVGEERTSSSYECMG